MRKRFCASFRMAKNAERTPELTRQVQNWNVPRNKIKSAIVLQKSYRLEWDLIIWLYLNLYVHCISFITRLFLLWKLTGAKSNFETMFLQERTLSVINLASLLVNAMLGCRHSSLRHINILRFSHVECTFSNIPTCVHLQVGGHYLVLLA